MSADETTGPSLVDGKNNSRAAIPAETGQSRLSRFTEAPETSDDSHRYDCRAVYSNMEMEADDGETAAFRCNSWDCYCCAHRMRMNLIEDLERLVDERPEMRRLLTLTVAPENVASSDEKHAYITERWNTMRTLLNEEYPGLSYVWIRHEGDENGRPHLHLLVDRYLPQEMLSEMSAEVGLGEVVDIRRVDARNAAHYLTSYLGKGALANLPDGLRRYGSSSDIDLDVRGSGDDAREWDLMMNDWNIVDETGPLRRRVTRTDLAQQREWGGAVPPD